MRVVVTQRHSATAAEQSRFSNLVDGRGTIIVMSGASTVHKTEMLPVSAPKKDANGLTFSHWVGSPGRSSVPTLSVGSYSLFIALGTWKSNVERFEVIAQPKAPTFETRLLGVWSRWSAQPEQQSQSCTLLSMAFHSNAVVRWVKQCDGKRSEHEGRYSIEASANIYHPTTITRVIRIQERGANRETGIHLFGVKIDSDNRVPMHSEVLRFQDAFASSFIFVKEDGQSSGRVIGE